MSDSKLIAIGRAVKPFGIKGEVKISPFTESFEAFKNSAVLVFGESPFKVSRIGYIKVQCWLPLKAWTRLKKRNSYRDAW